MLNILLSGVSGAMGANLQQIIKEADGCSIVAGYDHQEDSSLPFPVYTDLDKCREKIDVIIDFSHFKAFSEIFGFASSHKIPIVIATTGLSEDDLETIANGAQNFPIFKTANMS